MLCGKHHILGSCFLKQFRPLYRVVVQGFEPVSYTHLDVYKRQGQTLSLLNDGATIPFISRYRKEMTGGLDEVQIEAIQTHYEKLNETDIHRCGQSPTRRR